MGVWFWHMVESRRYLVQSLGRMGLTFAEELQLGAKFCASAGGFDSLLLFGFALWGPRLHSVRLGTAGSFYAVFYASCCDVVC